MPRPKSDIQPRILVAAREQFLQHGVDGSSLRAVAKAAGTSVGMIHYYYPNKDDLFLAVVEEPYAVILADLKAALAADADVQVRIRRLFHRVAALSSEELSMLRLIAREALISSTRFDRLFERFRRGHIPLFLELLQDGMAAETFEPRHPPGEVLIAILALAGPAQLLRRVAGERGQIPGVSSGPEVADALLDVLLHGIARQSAESSTKSEPAP